MKAKGIDVCGFGGGAGEPDFDTPEHIKAAAIAALEAGFTIYAELGHSELRQAIAEKLAADNQLNFAPPRVEWSTARSMLLQRGCAFQRATKS